MSVAKVLEVISQGKTIEEAIQAAARETAKTVHNIKQINVEHIEAIVENGVVTTYRVNSKVTFVVDENR